MTQAEAQTAELQRQVQACREQCPESSSVQVLEQQHRQAQAAEAAAREQWAACQQRQQRAHEAVRGLGQDYHPFDLQTGQALDENAVAQRLAGHFDQLDQIAAEAGLSARATQKLAKARRVLKAMQATVKFYWALLEAWISSWNLSPPIAQWLRADLIPGRYLARAAEKAEDASERHRLRELSEKILARARSPTGVWGTLSPEQRLDLERKAQACADLFQRSSSCVEGRNGHLALKHHALHQFTTRKLQALTVLHNYVMRRADGTTAAERFYGAAPRDCFTWLLDRLAVPARPRAGRRARVTPTADRVFRTRHGPAGIPCAIPFGPVESSFSSLPALRPYRPCPHASCWHFAMLRSRPERGATWAGRVAPAGSWPGYAHRRRPSPLWTQPRLPPANPTRANVGPHGRHLPDRGYVAHVAAPVPTGDTAATSARERDMGERRTRGRHLPGRGQPRPGRGYVAHVATPGPQATTPVNAAWANVGKGGGIEGDTCRSDGANTLPDSGGGVFCARDRRRMMVAGPTPVWTVLLRRNLA